MATTSKALKELIRAHVLWISGEKDIFPVWKEKKNGKTNVTRLEVSEGETTKR